MGPIATELLGGIIRRSVERKSKEDELTRGHYLTESQREQVRVHGGVFYGALSSYPQLTPEENLPAIAVCAVLFMSMEKPMNLPADISCRRTARMRMFSA